MRITTAMGVDTEMGVDAERGVDSGMGLWLVNSSSRNNTTLIRNKTSNY